MVNSNLWQVIGFVERTNVRSKNSPAKSTLSIKNGGIAKKIVTVFICKQNVKEDKYKGGRKRHTQPAFKAISMQVWLNIHNWIKNIKKKKGV